MKAKSFLAVLCVLLMTLAIVGCGSADGGTGGDRVTVAVDESIPAIIDDLLDVEFTGNFPSGENEAAITATVRDFIGAFQTARYNYAYDLDVPGEARAAGAEDDNTEIGGQAYDNYKVPGKDIYVEGYSNFTGTKSYREKPNSGPTDEADTGPVAGDTEKISSDGVWAITYDNESFVDYFSEKTYHLSGKAVNKKWENLTKTYTTSDSGTISGNNGSSEKEAFAVSDGEISLKYILEISYSNSGTGVPFDEEEEEEEEEEAPPVTDADYVEYWNENLSTVKVYIAVYDMSDVEKLKKDSSNDADKRWIMENIISGWW